MTSLPVPQDPEFNINTATNTFYKALGDRVASGQMTLDQARAAQAEMRALQLNPAAANRQTATDIAQRHLQVGRYSPSQPQGGLTAIAPQPTPMPLPRMPIMPQPPEREVIGYMTPPPGVRSGDTRIFADQPVTPPPMPERHSEYGIPLWMQLRPGPERDAAYAQFMKGQGGGMQPKGIGGMLQPDSGYGSQQPMISDMAYRGPYKKPRMLSPNDFSIARGPIPLDQQGPPLGGGIGAILGSLKTASQGVGGMPMPPKGLTLSNVPQQQRLTLSNVPQQGVAPQPMSAPQGMAMGGLMEKYYGGGMC